MQWEQAQPGRKVELDIKDKLGLLLKAQKNDPAVTTIDLESVDLTAQCGAWLGTLLRDNDKITKMTFVRGHHAICNPKPARGKR